MKITELHIEGFRSLKNVTWKPGALNVVIGPNGSGKSNLLRLLEMISASAQGYLKQYFIKMGGVSVALWDGQVEGISINIRTSDIYELDDPFDVNNGDELLYEAALLSPPPFHAYFFILENLSERNEGTGFVQPLFERDSVEASYLVYNRKRMPPSKQEIEEGFLADDESFLSTRLAGASNNLRSFQVYLAFWRIFSDFRTDQEAPLRLPSVTRLEKQVSADGQNLISVLHTLYTEDRGFKRSVNTAMRAAFGEDFEELIFPPASDQRIQMRVRWKTLQREQSTADLSDGTLRFLFLITVLANPNPPPLIAIDEPETGLHPSMLAIIAEYAEEASERTQIIFTTHSAQFLSALRRVRPTTTIAQWEEGETKLTVLDNEQLDHWLKEYTLGEMMLSGTLESLT